jgi:hypothetical protein
VCCCAQAEVSRARVELGLAWFLVAACCTHHAGHMLHAAGLHQYAHGPLMSAMGSAPVTGAIGALALLGPGRRCAPLSRDKHTTDAVFGCWKQNLKQNDKMRNIFSGLKMVKMLKVNLKNLIACNDVNTICASCALFVYFKRYNRDLDNKIIKTFF